MRKHIALLLSAFVAVGAFAATKPAPPATPVTVDTHADTPTEYLKQPFNLGAWNAKGEVDYPRMKAGGLDAEFFAAYVPAKYANKGAAAFCMKIMETIHEMVDRYPTWARFASSTSDIRAAAHDGKRAILIGIEGGHAIEDSLDLLRAFYRFGARYMTLTHTNTNNWADASTDEERHNGLTPFGRQVVLEMNRLGMLVDISHVSDKTFYDVIATSKAPVFASHSSARALSNHKRNMTDDMLRALAKNGGVVMINYHAAFLSEEFRAAPRSPEFQAQSDAIAKKCGANEACSILEGERLNRDAMQKGLLPKVSWEKIIEHIDHAVKVAGVDHVGLGSDFDGATMPFGMEDASKLPRITDALLKKGYSARDVENILGNNILRVMEQVERVAHGGS